MRPSLVLLLCLACSKPAATEAPAPAVPSGAAVGTPCQQHGDCQDGLCEGQGCDVPGRCVDPRQRACTEDLVTYCGCDGKELTGSSTCPGGRYAHRGPCTTIDAALPPDATVAAPAVPQAPSPPAPDVKKADPLFACATDRECTIYWREVGACFPGKPLAINAREEATAGKRFPRVRDRMGGCGMGGPQYEERRRAHDARWGVKCSAKRCQMVDHGAIQPIPL